MSRAGAARVFRAWGSLTGQKGEITTLHPLPRRRLLTPPRCTPAGIAKRTSASHLGRLITTNDIFVVRAEPLAADGEVPRPRRRTDASGSWAAIPVGRFFWPKVARILASPTSPFTPDPNQVRTGLEGPEWYYEFKDPPGAFDKDRLDTHFNG
ncbi:hypothetical protein EVAR_94275_1 [Eumeta japonica]|uniref:Uncharacterized protein n=1 Tax=Eumeta variegata TaxID=151549 RepID=A0A4C1UEV5_EUMVA|nr:hypothetical protein EVAR_94275_1 [Eumeta japonica]